MVLRKRPPRDAKLVSLLRPCFIEASLMVERSCIVLESGPTRSLVAKLLQCSSLVVRKLRVHDAGEELCEQGYRRVCAKL